MRQSLSKKLRFTVFERDSFICQYCGKNPNDHNIVLHVDHAISVKDGGTNAIDNLVTACIDCNLGKGKKSVIKKAKTKQDIKEELQRTQERLEQIRAMNQIGNLKDEIEKERYRWATDMLDGYSASMVKKTMSIIRKTIEVKLVDKEKVREALKITDEKFATGGEFVIAKFHQYFYGVLRNLNMTDEEREIMSMYNNLIFKNAVMYNETRKFIMETVDALGIDGHYGVIEFVEECWAERMGNNYKMRDEAQQYCFGKTNYTVSKSGANLNYLVCDSIAIKKESRLKSSS